MRDLRRSYQLITLMYDVTDDSMGANNFGVENAKDGAVISFNLEPQGSNHKDDVANLESFTLQVVQVDDEKTISGLNRFLSTHNASVNKLIIRFNSNEYKYGVNTRIDDNTLWININ